MKATSPTTFSVKNVIDRYSPLFLEMLWVLSTRWWKSMKLQSKQWWKKHHPLLVLSGNDTSVQIYSLSTKEINVNTTGQWSVKRFNVRCYLSPYSSLLSLTTIGSYHLISPPATGPFLAETPSIKPAVTSREGRRGENHGSNFLPEGKDGL